MRKSDKSQAGEPEIITLIIDSDEIVGSKFTYEKIKDLDTSLLKDQILFQE
jgi:hypothetical protein